MQKIEKDNLNFINENTKQIFKYAIGISLLGMGASLLYQKIIFPKVKKYDYSYLLFQKIQQNDSDNLYPLQHLYQRMKNTIDKVQRKQNSIISLSILKRIKIAQNGITFNFSVLQDLEKKPVGSSRGQTSNPFLPPFEDGLFVQELSQTHTLLFNKFAVVKNHMLVVTTKFEYQNSLINANDFSAAHKVLLSLKGFWFFNSGPDAGASQQHKHIQVMPIEARQDTPILNVLNKRIEKIQRNAENIIYVPFEFVHIIKILNPMQDEQSIEDYGIYLENCYLDCMNMLQNVEESNDGQKRIKNAYNMIVMDNFMMIVLRKQERTLSSPQIAINGMGFTGSFLLKSNQEIQKNDTIEPFKLLQEVSQPIVKNNKLFKLSPINGFNDIEKAVQNQQQQIDLIELV